MKKIYFLFVAVLLFASCSAPKDPFQKNSLSDSVSVKDDDTTPKDRTITINLYGTSNNQTRYVGTKLDGERVFRFQWEQGDKINLVYYQNGVCHKATDVKVLEIENNIATIKPIVPSQININMPYDIYGFVGNASWKEPFTQGNPPSIEIYANDHATTNYMQVTKNIPLYFSLKNVTSTVVSTSLNHLGMIVAVSIANNSSHNNPETVDVKKLSLRITDANNKTSIPKPTDGKYTFSFKGNSGEEKLESLDINCSGTISRGDEKTFYNWVYYPSEYNMTNTKTVFDVYANGKIYTLVGEIPAKKQTAGLSFNYCASFYEGKMYAMPAVPSEIRGNEWMKHIENDRPFLSLLLTGTHDAATYANGWSSGFGYVKCQDKDFAKQFACGVRALDLRPKGNQNNKDVLIYHGPISTGINMSKAFNDAIDFLDQNPSETIVFLIKDENSNGGKDIEWGIKYLVDANQRYIYQKSLSKNTKLSDVRGKIILIFRDELLAYTNKKMYVGGWKDNAEIYAANISEIGLTPDRQNWTYSGLFPVILEDNYKKPDKDDKIRFYKQALQTALDNNMWNLSYLSANGAPFGWNPWQYAEYINPRITEYYKREVDVNYSGITFVDFAGYKDGSHNGEELVRQMYLNNFKKPWNN